jgi:hypothetical protein
MKHAIEMGRRFFQGKTKSIMEMFPYNQLLQLTKELNFGSYSYSVLSEKLRLDKEPFVIQDTNLIDGTVSLRFIDTPPEFYVFNYNYPLTKDNVWFKAAKTMLERLN